MQAIPGILIGRRGAADCGWAYDCRSAAAHPGGGSNLLLTGDYQGTVLHSAIKGIEVLENRELATAEHDDDLLNPDWVFLNCGSGEVLMMWWPMRLSMTSMVLRI